MSTAVYQELWHTLEKSWLQTTDLERKRKEFPGMVVVRSLYSLISGGTERLATTQGLTEETGQRMMVPYMQGHFGDRFTYGYSLVGEVMEGPARWKGQLVHLLHPHQNYAFVSEEDLFTVPEGISPKTATLASNMETAVNALWDAELALGDQVLVVGYGMIGALVAGLARAVPGVRVVVVEPDSGRAGLARGMGLEVADAGDLPQNTDFQVAFHASGNAKGLQMAIDTIVPEGKVVELSWYGSKVVTLRLGDSFHYGRKKIISSQVSNIPESRRAHWDLKKRKELVFKLLRQHAPEPLIAQEIRFGEAPAFFDGLRKGEPSQPGVVINYQK